MPLRGALTGLKVRSRPMTNDRDSQEIAKQTGASKGVGRPSRPEGEVRYGKSVATHFAGLWQGYRGGRTGRGAGLGMVPRWAGLEHRRASSRRPRGDGPSGTPAGAAPRSRYLRTARRRSTGGRTSRQRDIADGQRAANRHPAVSPSGRPADAPILSVSEVRSALARGMEDSSSWV